MMRPFVVGAAVVALYVLHQDVWFWHTARPLTFGFLPVGLAYHALYCLAAAALMWALTTFMWPVHLQTPERGDLPAASADTPPQRAGVRGGHPSHPTHRPGVRAEDPSHPPHRAG